MSSVIQPLKPGDSSDPEVNELLQQSVEGWWNDSAMFGVIGRQPDLLKTIVPVFSRINSNRCGGMRPAMKKAAKTGTMVFKRSG